MIDVIGWLGAFLLGICGAPQAYKSYKLGYVGDSISSLFLWSWYIGETLMIAYIPLSVGWNWPIMSNLIINFLCITIIMKYKYWPTSK